MLVSNKISFTWVVGIVNQIQRHSSHFLSGLVILVSEYLDDQIEDVTTYLYISSLLENSKKSLCEELRGNI